MLCALGWGEPQEGRQWAHPAPFFCKCSGSGGGHEPGALRLLTAGPDLRTMGTQLTVHLIQAGLSLGWLEGSHRNAGRKGSKGTLQKRLQEKALAEKGVKGCGKGQYMAADLTGPDRASTRTPTFVTWSPWSPTTEGEGAS